MSLKNTNFKKIKTITAILLVLLITVCLDACEKKPESALEEIQMSGKLSYTFAKEPSDADRLFIKTVAEELGVEAELNDEVYSVIAGCAVESKIEGWVFTDCYADVLSQIPDDKQPLLVRAHSEYYCAAVKSDEYNADLLAALEDIVSRKTAEGVFSFSTGMFGGLGTVDTSMSDVYAANTNLTPVRYDSKSILAISEDLGNTYQDELVIVCDSPNYWMKPGGLLSGGKNTKQIWTGIEGTMTFPYYKGMLLLDPNDGQEKLLVDMTKEHQPKIMVIALGINGIAGRDEERFSSLYESMIRDLKAASPNTTFICTSIYPVTKDYKKQSVINNTMITATNMWILNICERNDCYYLDTCSVFWGEDGFARPELIRNDGLHPNAEGLSLVLDYIRTHACVQDQ